MSSGPNREILAYRINSVRRLFSGTLPGRVAKSAPSAATREMRSLILFLTRKVSYGGIVKEEF